MSLFSSDPELARLLHEDRFREMREQVRAPRPRSAERRRLWRGRRG